MKFQRKKVATALAYVLGVGSVALLTAAPAQAADIRVDVTGSNIKRLEGEGAVPVQIITREEIERTGATTALELMQYVSANSSSGQISSANVIGATTFSVQTASLRGLGGQNTLVLLNGKRLTAASGETQGVYGVNLDSIPFSAIERVEILKDGASAIYGSDAIGGVINFILRQDFSGIQAQAYYGVPTRGGGGGEIGNASLTAGWGDLTKDKFNIFGSLYYQKQEALNQNKRSFADSSLDLDQGLVGVSGNTFPGHITTGNIGTPSYPNCYPSIPGGDLGARCFYDPAAADGVNAIPQAETTSFFASGRYQFNPNWQGYATFAYTKQETRFIIQPTPLSDQITYGPNAEYVSRFLLPPTSPYYPTAQAIAAGVNGQPLNVRYRAYSLGLRDQTDKNDSWQGVLGVKGSSWNWDFDFDFVYSKSETTESTNGGFARYSQIVPLLNTGLVNPFGTSSAATEAALQALQYRQETFTGESTGYMIEGKASGDIWKLPAGPLSAAFGFQAGRQELQQTPNLDLQAGDVTGYGGNQLPNDASRKVWAVYAEFAIPIIKTLDLTAAVRYDHYSDFGSTTNPKFSLRWQPTKELLFRGSWGTGFVAPTLTQAYGGNFTGLSQAGLEDPLRCPTTKDTNDCLTQFTLAFGGNPDLKPQTSTQWQVGGVWEPTAGFSFGVDYFSIDLDNLFSNGVTPETILNDQAQYGNLITRGPVQPQYPTIPGPITSIDQRFINLGKTKIRGFDVDMKYNAPATSFGRFSATLSGTYYQTYDQQQVDGTFAGFVSNQFGAATTGVWPRYKQYATVSWQMGPWGATLGNQYQSSYIDTGTDGADNLRRVGSMSLWDLYGNYTGFKNWNLAVGVKNIFDEDPPFTNQRTTFQSGYDPSYYDARARFIYFTATYTFK